MQRVSVEKVKTKGCFFQVSSWGFSTQSTNNFKINNANMLTNSVCFSVFLILFFSFFVTSRISVERLQIFLHVFLFCSVVRVIYAIFSQLFFKTLVKNEKYW